MFGRSKREKEEKRISALCEQTRFYEYIYNYIILITTSGGQVPFTHYMMLDYASMQIMQLSGVPEHQLSYIRNLYREEHDKLIKKLSRGEEINPESFKDKLKEQQIELKKLGIDFKLQMPSEKEIIDIKPTDPAKEPKLTQRQIDKIIEDNFDRVIDLYLKRKKEGEKENGSQGVQGIDL